MKAVDKPSPKKRRLLLSVWRLLAVWLMVSAAHRGVFIDPSDLLALPVTGDVKIGVQNENYLNSQGEGFAPQGQK
jgi:hypothetical protein